MPKYGDPNYWEERYRRQRHTTFDWLENYDSLRGILANLVDKSHTILNIGCGNATVTEEMYDDGYKHIWNMDISEEVIHQMRERNFLRPEMVWETGDILNMKYPDELFDVVFDKSNRCLTQVLWMLFFVDSHRF